ncbi:hydroxyacylglutathione hydrolase [Azospirillum sp. SYSU D00513]|uniref:hydroxyacylglutathione hydrolase n=1 Tax=Azospirillum sp. SYSU D00513 TaxID=2812561 RepID=UPI001A96361E|nr:hydroxyacylglutathione hydrolase [Azospirillum sp. SYSU D00513]
MDVHLIPALSDNYVYLISDPASGAVGVVDPGEAEPVLAALDRLGLKLTHILNTHHHGDHIGGNQTLKQRFGATLIGPRAESARIPDMDATVGEGDSVRFGSQTARVFETPGHTSGHIAFWFETAGALFSGDTLFALGCGRLFEGTPTQMWTSLFKLRALPGATRVYCGHEYTLSNARFAVTVDPENRELHARVARVEAQRARGEPTVPSTLEEEVRTNPFLRADQPSVQAAVGMSGAAPTEVFAEIRRRKDVFRG